MLEEIMFTLIHAYEISNIAAMVDTEWPCSILGQQHACMNINIDFIDSSTSACFQM